MLKKDFKSLCAQTLGKYLKDKIKQMIHFKMVFYFFDKIGFSIISMKIIIKIFLNKLLYKCNFIWRHNIWKKLCFLH